MKHRKTFKLGSTLQVFRYGKTTNAKISQGKENILQTYTFSVDQFNYVKDCLDKGTKTSFKEFFTLDAANCFDCPFSSNSGTAKCYTHKFMQYSGFVSMLRSIVKEFVSLNNIPEYSIDLGLEILELATNKYVRFGSYGEPTMHPLQLVKGVAKVAKSWTGYTHQYMRKPEYNNWFMASTHSQMQADTASDKFGFRSFIAVKDNNNVQAVICPASKESKADANCSDCGLCSGVVGKGKKDVVIIEH
jgi:hypothetical protein